MKNSDTVLLEKLYSEYILNSEKETPSNDVELLFNTIDKTFKSKVLSIISHTNHPTLDYTGNDKNDMKILTDEVHLAYDVNINNDRAIESQIVEIKEQIDNLLIQHTATEIVTYKVTYELDKQAEKEEVSGSRSEWIAVNVVVREMRLPLDKINTYFKFLLMLDSAFRNLVNVMVAK